MHWPGVLVLKKLKLLQLLFGICKAAKINRISRQAVCADPNPTKDDEYKKCKYHICGEAQVDGYPQHEIRNLIKSREKIMLFGSILNATFDLTYLENR